MRGWKGPGEVASTQRTRQAGSRGAQSAASNSNNDNDDSDGEADAALASDSDFDDDQHQLSTNVSLAASRSPDHPSSECMIAWSRLEKPENATLRWLRASAEITVRAAEAPE
uniref:Ig-like domain-containing protein n=1 Tax=Mycena chlorophos TaxID=658473 RepID=A0ABQ0LPJ2_MYCCL|nr:predicted protein [Mycena chlorophos]